MKVLTSPTQYKKQAFFERFQSNPEFQPANQMLKYDTVSFGTAKIPDEALTKEVQALSEEFVKHLTDIEDAVSALFQKLKPKKGVEKPNEAEAKEAAKVVDEAASNTLTFIESLKTKPKKMQEEFTLHIDENGESHGHFAIICKHKQIAPAFLDFVKTLDKPVQERFATLVTGDSNCSHLHLAILEGKSEFALKYIDFLEPLSQKTKATALLHKDGDGNSVFHTSLLYDQPDATRKIFEIVKGLDKSDQETFAYLENYDNESHFYTALTTYEPEIARDLLDFVKGLSDTAKREFIAYKRSIPFVPIDECYSHFETAGNNYPQIALDFLDFALDVAPKEVPSFRISHNADSEFYMTTARKVLACENLETAEKLTFLKKNNEEGLFDAMIAELE